MPSANLHTCGHYNLSNIMYQKLYKRSAEKWQKNFFCHLYFLRLFSQNSFCHSTYFWQSRIKYNALEGVNMGTILGIVAALIVGGIFSLIPKKELQLKENEDPTKRKGQLFLMAFIIFVIAAIIFVAIDMSK